VNISGHFALRDQKVETVIQMLGLYSCFEECEHNSDVVRLIASTQYESEARLEIFGRDLAS
jgi:hypothetical protein